MYTQSMKYENGSAIIYILIAIAMIAALTFAVTQGSRTGEGSISKEQASLAATEILDYANTVANAVSKLRLRGCSDTEISFENNIVAGYPNGTNTLCQVFHADGGNINFINKFNASDEDIFFNTELRLEGFGNAFDLAELVMYLRYISDEVCLEINRRSNISTEADGTPAIADFKNGPIDTKFTGIYDDLTGQVIDNTIGPTPGDWVGKDTGCYKTVGGFRDGNHFYKVLIAR